MRGMIALSLVVLAAPAGAANDRFQSGTTRWSGKPAPRETARFRPAMLEVHNAARRAYGVRPLVWNEALARDAAAWARALAGGREFDHDPQKGRNPPQGENLFKGTRGAYAFEHMVQLWVDERRWFKKGRFPNVTTSGHWSRVGHYTQIVWPSSREVGCALTSNAREDFLVCRYFPAGNYFGVEMR